MKGMVKTYRGNAFTESQLHQIAWVNGRWFAVRPTTYANAEDYEYANFVESELVGSGYEYKGYGSLDSELDEAFARDKAEKLHRSHNKNGAIYYDAPRV